MDDDDPVELSAHALAALNEFYQERDSARNNFDEDWELSQFWYDDETSNRLAAECLRLIDSESGGRVACVCCPTLYETLKNRIEDENVRISLFEYDARFDRYQDFVFYDYRQSLDELWPRAIEGGQFRRSFDVVVADPPFLSEECAGRVVELARELRKPDGKLIFCTGATMESFLLAALDEEKAKVCETFEPRHKRKLGNEFRCYVNYDGAFPVSL